GRLCRLRGGDGGARRALQCSGGGGRVGALPGADEGAAGAGAAGGGGGVGGGGGGGGGGEGGGGGGGGGGGRAALAGRGTRRGGGPARAVAVRGELTAVRKPQGGAPRGKGGGKARYAALVPASLVLGGSAGCPWDQLDPFTPAPPPGPAETLVLHGDGLEPD